MNPFSVNLVLPVNTAYDKYEDLLDDKTHFNMEFEDAIHYACILMNENGFISGKSPLNYFELYVHFSDGMRSVDPKEISAFVCSITDVLDRALKIQLGDAHKCRYRYELLFVTRSSAVLHCIERTLEGLWTS